MLYGKPARTKSASDYVHPGGPTVSPAFRVPPAHGVGRRSLGRGAGAEPPPRAPCPRAEAEKLRGEHRDTQSVLTKLEDKERELKETLAKDFGSLRQFEPLQHECFDVTQGEWIYSICPYTDSKQKGKHGGGSTDLGRWEGWADGYTAMEFKNGQACWNGPIRSLRVQVRCGGESKLLKVDEPEVCKYVADFETPGACTEEDARLAQLEVESCAADVEE